ncbi:MAG: glutamine--fructose-6-phosphate transaminase (isomerizing) [Clostridia bacterium]|nr:glutamine--fructose-6-phosphate transaminase (isomerizing) [Clostridia bacterium]
MCGITGYIGNKEAKEFLIEGLKRLEYRGYDSSGICVLEEKTLKTLKAKGKLSNLIDITSKETLSSNIGIGHTRWATHGAPTVENSHPHLSADGNFAVVHNGIIENYRELKSMLEDKGFKFVSQTDTEVIPFLLQYNYKGNILDAVKATVGMLKGAFALVILSTYDNGRLYAVRKDSPLILGRGEKETYIASDIPAILPYTKEIYLLEQDEIAIAEKEKVTVLNKEGKEISKEPFSITWDVKAAEKDGYEHFMLKEIMEQPNAIEKTVLPRINNEKVDFSEISLTEEYVRNISRIFIVACGSAYHAGIVGRNLIEAMARVSVQTELASEFRYMNPIINKDDLVIIISQSGETSDTLASLRYAKEKGAKILSIVNVKGSTIARESDDVLYTNAGPEIAVATTKAYICQVQVLNLLAIYIATAKGMINSSEHTALLHGIKSLPREVSEVLKKSDEIKQLAKKFKYTENAFFIGRGLDYAVALEGSLKLKEISYVHSEAYAAGELKHGTISLIEEGTLVIALATCKTLFDKMLSNIKEVKARGATVVAIVSGNGEALEKEVDFCLSIPETCEMFSGTAETVLLQLLAYYITCEKGYDPDKPRNLAKSVTVE